MRETIPATGEFRTRQGAEGALSRLLRAGFTRSSIEVAHDEYGYVIKANVYPENRMRAQRTIQSSGWLASRSMAIAVLLAVAMASRTIHWWATKPGRDRAGRSPG